MERPVWFKKLRLKFNLALDIDRSNRCSEPHNFIHKLLLRGRRKVHARLGTKPRIKEIHVVLDRDVLDRFFSERCPFFGAHLPLRVKPPPRTKKQCQHDDKQNNDLPG
jgi:hypothetical protein